MQFIKNRKRRNPSIGSVQEKHLAKKKKAQEKHEN
jgi:hypothetical protein